MTLASHRTPGAILRLERVLALAFTLLVGSPAWGADPSGIGGPADSLLSVESQAGICGPPGVVCFDAVGTLPLADYSLVSTSNIFATGAIDHPAGELSGAVTYTQPGSAFSSDGRLEISARDRFTVIGPTPGATVSITARLRVEGTIQFTGNPSLKSAVVEALLSTAPNGWDPVNGGLVVSTGTAGLFSTGLNPSSDFFNVDIEAVATFDVTEGEAFELVYRMDLEGGQAGGTGVRSTELDFGSTGTLTFDLPADHTITSELGYPGSGPEAVPGPPWWTLTAALISAAGFALRARRPKRSRL